MLKVRRLLERLQTRGGPAFAKILQPGRGVLLPGRLLIAVGSGGRLGRKVQKPEHTTDSRAVGEGWAAAARGCDGNLATEEQLVSRTVI